ncbi:MAG: DNA-3-methyladenine glycosylase [Prolixibacteraceae bacterium]|nr:DNA-3-methyladenine glycosylase [Prolixibacteraceae bacterium]
MKNGERIKPAFFRRDVLEVAPALLGKTLVRRFDSGTVSRFVISETEAYRGADDKACHAHKGRTPRTEVMFREGGLVYVYLIYGIYWMLNFVTGDDDEPAAVLIRGIENTYGPGKTGKILQLDRSFYGEDLFSSPRIWLEGGNCKTSFTAYPRVGIQYAGEPWISMPWRFRLNS